MQSLLLGSYILIWPLASLAVLAVILTATLKDLRKAKQEQRGLV
ncbi:MULTISPECIES: putative transporter small subunit [Pseudomonas]|nr:MULTISPECIES: putative transporter small subunit [Pseudomonas]